MFNPDFKDMLSELSVADVDYLVVGAYAVAAHGVPRATGDLDIWIRADNETAPRMLKALVAFGAPLYDLSEEDLASPGIVFQIGVPPGRIDILTSVSGLIFDDAWQRRLNIEIEGIAMPVLSLEDLIANKLAAGRDKDLLDVKILRKSTGG